MRFDPEIFSMLRSTVLEEGRAERKCVGHVFGAGLRLKLVFRSLEAAFYSQGCILIREYKSKTKFFASVKKAYSSKQECQECRGRNGSCEEK